MLNIMTTYHFSIETTDYRNQIQFDEDIYKLDTCETEDKRLNALKVLWKNGDQLSKTIDKLIGEQDDAPILFFPFSLETSKDLKSKGTENRRILQVTHDSRKDRYFLSTEGLMGFISATFTDDVSKDDYHFNIYIHSRFDYSVNNDIIELKAFKKVENEDKSEVNTSAFQHDYFLHYMLQRVLNINLFDCDPDTSDNHSELGLLLYFFPGLLRRAMKQGLYKQYVHREYNDSKVRGPIDVSRHIRYNIPFSGKIVYSATEYDYDNPITELVRHTIEYIRHHEWAVGLLSQSDETLQDVQLIVNNTERYSTNERRIVIAQCRRLLNHPFYTEWRPLQHLCLSILRHEDIRYDSFEDEDRIHGILFDGPWLWENYLDWLFNTKNSLGFVHPDNTTGENAIYLFEKNGTGKTVNRDDGIYDNNGKTQKYPDFYKPSNPGNGQLATEIWDAKFKHYDGNNSINRDDVHQLITYLYVQSDKNRICDRAGVVFPIGVGDNEKESYCQEVGTLKGFGATLYKWGLKIPTYSEVDYDGFCNRMEINEKTFIEKGKYSDEEGENKT